MTQQGPKTRQRPHPKKPLIAESSRDQRKGRNRSQERRDTTNANDHVPGPIGVDRPEGWPTPAFSAHGQYCYFAKERNPVGLPRYVDEAHRKNEGTNADA